MKILVALNSKTYSEYLSFRFKKMGDYALVVSDGLSALDALESEPWDVVFIAVALDYFNGLEVIERYYHFVETLAGDKEKHADFMKTRFIIVTRLRNEKVRKNALALGVSDYFQLPLKTSLLIDKVKV